jgi:nucleoside-diphosphate-sugar epimerase
VQGTALLVEAARKAGVQRFVFFSTIAVYGYQPSDNLPRSPVIDEESKPQPDTLYGQSKLAAESFVLQATGTDGNPLGVVLRLGAVYGKRVKGNYARMHQALSKGRFLPIGAGKNRRTLIYDQDVARATLLALEHPQALGRVYNVSDGDFHTVSEIIQAICAAQGHTPPRWAIPVRPARWLAGMVEDTWRLLGLNPPIRRATLDKYLEEVCVSGQRIQDELGFRPQFDLRRGWQEIAGLDHD